MAGFGMGLTAAVIFIGPTLAFFVESCFWEEGCTSSQAPRFFAAFVTATAIAALIGWAVFALLNRLFYRAGREVRFHSGRLAWPTGEGR